VCSIAASAPAITARWSAPRHVLLPAERYTAISAIAGFYRNFCFIYKHGALFSLAATKKSGPGKMNRGRWKFFLA